MEGVQIVEGWDMFIIDFIFGGIVDLFIWVLNIIFLQFWGYIFFGVEFVFVGWINEFFVFVYVSWIIFDVFGFGYFNLDKGFNVLNMVRIYSDFDVFLAFYFICIFEVLWFILVNEGVIFGIVEVIE